MTDNTRLLYTSESYLDCINNFFSKEQSDSWFEYIQRLPLIKYPKGKIFGKEITFHRSIGFFSDSSNGYKFSGQTIKTGNFTLELKQLIENINNFFSTNYNGILINIYYNGEDYISAHSDDEKDLDSSNKVIAISLGENRIFRIRSKKTLENTIISNIDSNIKMKNPVYDIETQHGQLIVMGGKFQKEFTHEIPIEKNKNNIRISITFRHHKK
jgi:alkylated DNA repair dioxygenase AlkB